MCLKNSEIIFIGYLSEKLSEILLEGAFQKEKVGTLHRLKRANHRVVRVTGLEPVRSQ